MDRSSPPQLNYCRDSSGVGRGGRFRGGRRGGRPRPRSARHRRLGPHRRRRRRSRFLPEEEEEEETEEAAGFGGGVGGDGGRSGGVTVVQRDWRVPPLRLQRSWAHWLVNWDWCCERMVQVTAGSCYS